MQDRQDLVNTIYELQDNISVNSKALKSAQAKYNDMLIVHDNERKKSKLKTKLLLVLIITSAILIMT